MDGSLKWNVSYPVWTNLFNDGMLVCDASTPGGTSIIVTVVRETANTAVFTGLSSADGSLL